MKYWNLGYTKHKKQKEMVSGRWKKCGAYVSEREYVAKFDKYRGADKSLARPWRKQATATEDFDFHISYLKS